MHDKEEAQQREYRRRTKDTSADRLIPYELFSIRLAIQEHSANVGKWAAILDSTLKEGFAALGQVDDAKAQEKIDALARRMETQIAFLRAASERNEDSTT